MNESIKICAIGIVCAILCVLVKNYRSDFLIPTRLTAVSIIFTLIIIFLSPLLDYIKKLMGMTLSYEYMEIIIKALGITYLVKISCEICRDCGESNIASGIEIAGKIEIMILSLPLVEKILAMSEELIAW